MDRLQRRLDEWQTQGLIDADTRQRILAYEAGREPGGWQSRTLLILGAGVIGIGIVSLIAANWASIPDGIKLGADLLLLIALALTILACRAGGVCREVLIVLFMITCLASIGLIAQIYHLSGRPWAALAYWSLMCLPIMLFARTRPAAWLWTSLSLLAFGLAVNDQLSLRTSVANRFDESAALTAWLASALLAGIGHQLVVRFDWWRFRGVLGFWWLTLGLGFVALLDGLHSVHEGVIAYAFDWYLIAGLSATLIVALQLRSDLRPASRWILGAIVVLVVAASHPGWLSIVQNVSFAHEHTDLLSAIVTLLVLTGGLAVAALERWRWAFQLFILLIGARFYVIYLQAFGGLAATGIGLIVSGLLIIALVSLWRWSLRLSSRFRRSPS